MKKKTKKKLPDYSKPMAIIGYKLQEELGIMPSRNLSL